MHGYILIIWDQTVDELENIALNSNFKANWEPNNE